MNTCPFHKLRSELPPIIPQIAKLPVDDRGYPVPWFVAWIDGKPEFRAADGAKWALAIAERRCWVCGDRIRGPKAFVIGPMCAISRNTAEPPCHIDCAEWSAQACPFLVKPNMVRRENNREYLKDKGPGILIERNPGVCCVWVTNSYKVYRDPAGGKLIHIGAPLRVTWWAEGRPAKRAEVEQSIDTGLPLLRELCVAAFEVEMLYLNRRTIDSILPGV